MQRLVPLFALLLLLPGSQLRAQETQDPLFIYEAYYQVNQADMEEWNRLYFEYSVPVLKQLQEEGKIQGWSHWQHQTGGSDYNVRFTARTSDWASLDTFWNEYLSRLGSAMPAEEFAASNRMIQAHRDEIWSVSNVTTKPDADWAYMYAATYRYNFADGEEWNRVWNDVAGPAINEAMEEGLVGGWVTLEHNTGGAHNYKVLYLFEDWDHIDDFFGKVGATLFENHPEDAQSFARMTQAHDDVIWVPTRQAGM